MKARRLDFLDGMRALCAIWVAVSHVWIYYAGIAPHHGFIGALTNWLLYSHFAVDVFIVLSGYCLSVAVASRGETSVQPTAFYLKRAHRILPAVYAALACAVVLHLICDRSTRLDGASILTNLFLLQDARPGDNIFDTPLWSVAVEWRIYSIFPILIWLALKNEPCRRAGFLGACLIAFTLTATGLFDNCSPWYLALFAAGVYAATGEVRMRNAATLAIATSATAAFLILRHPINDAGYATLPFPVTDTAIGLSAAAIMVLVSKAKSPRALFESRWLVEIGKVSFSLYLTHAISILAIIRIFDQFPSVWLPIEWVAIGFPLVMVNTVVFYRYFEAPFMRPPSARSLAAPLTSPLPVTSAPHS